MRPFLLEKNKVPSSSHHHDHHDHHRHHHHHHHHHDDHHHYAHLSVVNKYSLQSLLTMQMENKTPSTISAETAVNRLGAPELRSPLPPPSVGGSATSTL